MEDCPRLQAIQDFRGPVPDQQLLQGLLADLAWPYRSPRAIVGNAGRGNQYRRAKDIIQVGASAAYPLMTPEEIKGLPVKEEAAHRLAFEELDRERSSG
jgi:hypothetical protein